MQAVLELAKDDVHQSVADALLGMKRPERTFTQEQVESMREAVEDLEQAVEMVANHHPATVDKHTERERERERKGGEAPHRD